MSLWNAFNNILERGLNRNEHIYMTFPVAHWLRICLQCRRCKRCEFNPWVGKIPWRRKWKPISVFLLGKFHVYINTHTYIYKENCRNWLTWLWSLKSSKVSFFMIENLESQWKNLALVQRPENLGATAVSSESKGPRTISSTLLGQRKVGIPVPPNGENSASFCCFCFVGWYHI